MNAQADFSGIRKVVDVAAISANKYLRARWVLLGTSHGQDERGYPLTLYSLGKTEHADEPKDI